jgi:hypothetical protein
MKYVHYEETTGKILGYYTEKNKDIVPTPHTELSEDDYILAKENRHNKINEDGTTEKYDFRTQAEIDADNATEYQRLRADAYPSISDQMDMQYWDSVNGTTTWADAIAAVKAMYPKP